MSLQKKIVRKVKSIENEEIVMAMTMIKAIIIKTNYNNNDENENKNW